MVIEEYLQPLLNEFQKTSTGMFVPKDKSKNHYRHFGLRVNKELYLTDDEVLYICDKIVKDEYSVRVKAYFHIKNSFYNLLPTGNNEFLLYRKHQNFNRNKDKPVGLFLYVWKNDPISEINKKEFEGVCCVLSDEVYAFLMIKKLEKLDTSATGKLNKYTAHSCSV